MVYYDTNNVISFSFSILYNTGGRLSFFTFLKVLVLNFAMLIFGYLGETGAISKTGGFTLGFGAFFALCILYKTFLSKNIYLIIHYYIGRSLFSGRSYGLLYFTEDQIRNSGYNMLEFVAKCFVGIFFGLTLLKYLL